MEPVLALRGLTKRFSSHLALDQLSLEVPSGSFYSLLGPSGCGKTTTLRIVAGLDTPTAGDVWLRGERINDVPPHQRPVNTVFQNYALFPHLTVQGNIEFGLRRQQAKDRAQRVRNMLALLRLEGKENRLPAQLSGGERQRVALARSLVLQPQLLLLDEPLSAVDPALRKQLRLELKALQRQLGTTFLFVTHDQEEALSLSDGVAVLHQGRLEQAGTPQELYLAPRTRFVAEFLGRVNWINGAGVRPEALRLTRERPPAAAHILPAVIQQSLFLGNCVQVEARLASGDLLLAEVPQRSADFTTGESVHVWWHRADELPPMMSSQS